MCWTIQRRPAPNTSVRQKLEKVFNISNDKWSKYNLSKLSDLSKVFYIEQLQDINKLYIYSNIAEVRSIPHVSRGGHLWCRGLLIPDQDWIKQGTFDRSPDAQVSSCPLNLDFVSDPESWSWIPDSPSDIICWRSNLIVWSIVQFNFTECFIVPSSQSRLVGTN